MIENIIHAFLVAVIAMGASLTFIAIILSYEHIIRWSF